MYCAMRIIVGLEPRTKSSPARAKRSAAAGFPAGVLTALIMVHCRKMVAVNGTGEALIKRRAGAVHSAPERNPFPSPVLSRRGRDDMHSAATSCLSFASHSNYHC
jgi:hypothetical protein